MTQADTACGQSDFREHNNAQSLLSHCKRSVCSALWGLLRGILISGVCAYYYQSHRKQNAAKNKTRCRLKRSGSFQAAQKDAHAGGTCACLKAH